MKQNKKAKSPSLSDEHFIASMEKPTSSVVSKNSTGETNSGSPVAAPGLKRSPQTGSASGQTSKPAGTKPPLSPSTPAATTSGTAASETSAANTDYDDEFEDNDDAFDKSATLKANGAAANIYNNNMVNMLNNSTGSNGRLMSDGESVSSNEKIINRFNSDKSIYYSSV